MPVYMLSVHHVEGEAPPYATDEEMQAAFTAVGKFNEKIVETGAWVFGGGLHPPDTATVVDATKGDVVTTDGPFGESKEHIGGFWVVKCADLDAALELAREASVACANPVEVRPFQDDTEG